MAVLAGLTSALAGCYSTDEPVIEKGEWAPLEGEFICDMPSGQQKRYVNTEKKEGFLFPDYTYRGSDGSKTKVVNVSDNLYVAQSFEDGSYVYGYFDFVDDNRFIMLGANLLAKVPYIESLAERHGVEPERRSEKFVHLSGNKADIRAFLESHDKSLLMALSQCRRDAAS
jgi:hypothetical protein